MRWRMSSLKVDFGLWIPSRRRVVWEIKCMFQVAFHH